jgi:hypothetical protein
LNWAQVKFDSGRLGLFPTEEQIWQLHRYTEVRESRGMAIFKSLADFPFERMATPRMLRMLYGLHLLLGLIVGTWFLFNGFKSSTLDGLMALILGVAVLFLWTVCSRLSSV